MQIRSSIWLNLLIRISSKILRTEAHLRGFGLFWRGKVSLVAKGWLDTRWIVLVEVGTLGSGSGLERLYGFNDWIESLFLWIWLPQSSNSLLASGSVEAISLFYRFSWGRFVLAWVNFEVNALHLLTTERLFSFLLQDQFFLQSSIEARKIRVRVF